MDACIVLTIIQSVCYGLMIDLWSFARKHRHVLTKARTQIQSSILYGYDNFFNRQDRDIYIYICA